MKRADADLLHHLKRWGFRGVVVGFCQYEVAAIISGKTPTLTALSQKHRWLPWVILGGLAVHFYRSSD
jgi:hypothetical protein